MAEISKQTWPLPAVDVDRIVRRCDDELPEVGKFVLAFHPQVKWRITFLHKDGFWWWPSASTQGSATHWMPLPSEPNAESSHGGKEPRP